MSIPLPKTKILACPFCQSADLLALPHRITLTEVRYEMSCKNCGAGGGDAESVLAAVQKWNHRGTVNDTADLTNALGVAAVVFGMMHKVPDRRLLNEAVRRGWIVTPQGKSDGIPT